MAKLEPIVIYAPAGSFWRSPKAAGWSWMVIVRDENGALISDPETVRILFGEEWLDAPKEKPAASPAAGSS